MNLKSLLLIMLVFASDENENVLENYRKSGEQNEVEQPIVVKIEEDEYVKANRKTSNYIGVCYQKRDAKWYAYRHSKKESKTVHNGSYKDEERAAHASDTLARKLIANGDKGQKLNFTDDDTEVYPGEVQKINYIGVCYKNRDAKWRAYRWSKHDSKVIYYGTYKDEETAAHASDTLARKLIANGEKGHKLNFPDEDTEVCPENVKLSSNYIGVCYHKTDAKWCAYRHSKNEKKNIHNGTYKDEERAAHASDTLARKLMANGENGHKFNFPDVDTEVYPEQKMNYIGVCYQHRDARWCAYRWSKHDNKVIYYGTHKDEERAAYASDTLARELFANGEKGHILNFPNDTEEYPTYQKKKRKRPNNLGASQDNKSHQISKK